MPADVHEEVRLKWHRGVFDTQRVDDGVETLRAWLMGESHLQPTVDHTVTDTSQAARSSSGSTPAPHFDTVVLAFEGAAGDRSPRSSTPSSTIRTSNGSCSPIRWS